jgi:hypothetical protein
MVVRYEIPRDWIAHDRGNSIGAALLAIGPPGAAEARIGLG